MLRLCINYFYEAYWFAGEPVSVPPSGSGTRHGGDPAGTKVFAREYPNFRKLEQATEQAISGTSIPKQWLTAENGRQGEETIMVKTRESTPFVRTLRSGNGRGKNIGNREEKVSKNCWVSCSLIG